MFGLGSIWEEICNYVIRPHRHEYKLDVLGPRMFMIGNRIFEREDLDLVNNKGHTLKCSHFRPSKSTNEKEKLPCVVYLHGNCGSRCDALGCLPILLPMNITVFCFDFAGCGLSTGKWVTLGYFEQDDVKTVISHLKKEGKTSRIALWGRSMGAATALICAGQDEYNQLSAIICDSPFISLQEVIISLVKTYVKQVPKAMIKLGIGVMRKSIMSRAKFDINKLVPMEYAEKSEVPLYIGHAWGDKFIEIDQTERIFEAYGGPKRVIRFNGDHNSERPEEYMEAMRTFLLNILVVNNPDMPEKYLNMLMRKHSKDEEEIEGEEVYPQSPMPSRRNQMVLPQELLDEEQMKKVMIESSQEALDRTTDESEVLELISQIEKLNEELKEIQDKKSKYIEN